MTMNLVIVESPTKSKTIEKFLGKNYKVTASMGHLRDLPKSTFGVDVEHDFEPKYINIRGKGDLIKELKTLAKKADKVYLATDPDREGEAISWHLAHILDLEDQKSCRIEFHEITNTAVKDAIKHPRSIDMDMVNAQQARRILDRIVGYELSPLLWRKVRKGLSAGRVQSVAVKIVADRDREIEAFVPEEYWTLNAKLRENAKAPIFEAEAVKYKGKKLELKNAEEAHAAESALAKAHYIVNKAERKERKRHPVPPFTTSNLQQEANKKLNFSAKKTMMVAQQLYEGVSLGKASVGLITYMRTDSVRLADVAIDEIRAYIKNNLGNEYCSPKPNHYSAKKNAQDAHEAIRPTSVLRTPEEIAKYLTVDQLKLYTLIWKRAVASQMSDAVYDMTTLLIDADDYQLRATGSILRFQGFLALNSKLSDEEKDTTVPYIEVGKELVLHKLVQSFRQSEKLQQHIEFLYAKGSVYHIENGNLLYHGAVPMNTKGGFAVEYFEGRRYSGRALMDYCDARARRGYYGAEGSAARQSGQDFLWYLWCGKLSPLFGRSAMTTFERLYIADPSTHTEVKDPYYSWYNDEAACRRILAEFGLPGTSHIVNGHVPVQEKNGESPIKGGGRLVVIDGGFCRAYHEKTGIAGYTLVYSSRTMSLRTHQPFESAEKAVRENLDILSQKNILETENHRILVEDTDEGEVLRERVHDLKQLVTAYQLGWIPEARCEDHVW